jgi:hypothetical protein
MLARGPPNSSGTFSIWERIGSVIAVNKTNSAAMIAHRRQLLRDAQKALAA